MVVVVNPLVVGGVFVVDAAHGDQCNLGGGGCFYAYS